MAWIAEAAPSVNTTHIAKKAPVTGPLGNTYYLLQVVKICNSSSLKIVDLPDDSFNALFTAVGVLPLAFCYDDGIEEDPGEI